MATTTHYGIRDEYDPHFGRQRLTMWSGAFCSVFEGWATELPKHDGYMVELEYVGKIRVSCESPRTDENWTEVDDAIRAGIETLEKRHSVRRLMA